MAEVSITITTRRCDLAECQEEAVGTCEVCRADWCRGHGALFRGVLMRPAQKPASEHGRRDPAAEPNWRPVEQIEMQFCWAHMNRWKAALRAAAPQEPERAPA
jgi:hypothetical protein